MLLTFWLPLSAQGQSRLPSSAEPGREKPVVQPAPRGDFDIIIPAPKRAPLGQDVDSLRFLVREVVVEGATALPKEDLSALAAPIIGREVSLSDIIGIAEAIEARYRAEGYLLTRTVVPPQRTRSGIFKIQVVEGYVGAIAVEGLAGAEEARVRGILAPVVAQRPLRNDTMERALLLVNDLPGMKAAGLLKPSKDETGAADLVLTASVATMDVTASVDNRSSRYEGPWYANSDIGLNSVAGFGERVTAGVSSTPDGRKKKAMRLGYVQPMGTDGAMASLAFDYSMSRPGYTLEDQDGRTFSSNLGGRLSYPLLRTRANTITLDGGLTARMANSHLAGVPVSFDRWRVVDAKLSWLHSGWLSGVDSAAMGLSRGLPQLGGSARGDASLSRLGADPSFTKATFDLSRLQNLAPSWDLYLGTSGQYSDVTLLSGEEFALGGTTYGHGYDPSALVGDHGFGATASLRHDISALVPEAKSLMVYTFYDAGLVWIRSTGRQQGLSSCGAGLRSGLTDSLDATLEAAHRLQGAESTVGGHFARVILALSGRF
ncbi:ShlB/FhaC/HecB family hemolysin secretion/activation protein [Paramagnetospirillum kuznetsovii]|uniref:ShlB/FhaC/HecB family hemolysin secretion/activation protein n=1 Tax=Paramagnetospirillum kuznetsovii TaxID=2053833 RepID=UPI001374D5D4|nr:ShlB/FhaC/HecB family hemolysin secretion/activation protein [Paramagnetospirillum kuznetsovii]